MTTDPDPPDLPPGPTTRFRVTEVSGDGTRTERPDRVITEEPLEIRLVWPGVSARTVWLTMRTPGADFELAAGWLIHEQIAPPAGITDVRYCTDVDLRPDQRRNTVTVSLSSEPAHVPKQQATATTGSSACGICGSDQIADLPDLARHRSRPRTAIAPEVILGLPERLRAAQALFNKTGAVHASGLLNAAGELTTVREDVGRHNALDKVTGSRVLGNILGNTDQSAEPLRDHLLVLSGRVGFELVHKAVVAGASGIVAVGAPTSLSVRAARAAGLPLYGFTDQLRTVQYA